ncbi:MAG: SCO family protein [Pseudomonadota bacterium]
MNRNQLTLFIAIVAALLLARFALYTPEAEKVVIEPPQALQSLLLPEPRPLSEFTLSDHNGQPLTQQQLKDKWHFVFFGYTQCPDICPTTLGTLKAVATKLEAQPEISVDTRFLFVSVDPKRDSVPQLKDYIGYFHPDFIATTGERQEIDKLARSLGAIYLFEGDTEKDDYIVNHSASVALINPQGQWVARFHPPHTVKQFHSDYLQLRDYLQPQNSQD